MLLSLLFSVKNDLKLPNHNQHLILVIININSSNLLFSCTPPLPQSLSHVSLSTHFCFSLSIFFSLCLFFFLLCTFDLVGLSFRVKWKFKHRPNQPLHNIFHIHAPHLFESTVCIIICAEMVPIPSKIERKKKNKQTNRTFEELSEVCSARTIC